MPPLLYPNMSDISSFYAEDIEGVILPAGGDASPPPTYSIPVISSSSGPEELFSPIPFVDDDDAMRIPADMGGTEPQPTHTLFVTPEPEERSSFSEPRRLGLNTPDTPLKSVEIDRMEIEPEDRR